MGQIGLIVVVIVGKAFRAKPSRLYQHGRLHGRVLNHSGTEGSHGARTRGEEGQRGPWTGQAIQQIVKKYLKKLDLYEPGKSVHALRHSYAVALYQRERDLRAVQKQLRHVSIQTTQIYADVTEEDIKDQVKGLWGQG